jgi:hypothetical protein
MNHAVTFPHVTDYWVLRSTDPDELDSRVVTAIHNGWQPYGTLVLDHAGDETWYVQPMVRYAEWRR